MAAASGGEEYFLEGGLTTTQGPHPHARGRAQRTQDVFAVVAIDRRHHLQAKETRIIGEGAIALGGMAGADCVQRLLHGLEIARDLHFVGRMVDEFPPQVGGEPVATMRP